ncbi:hypothetical protein [Paenibacillus sedimenti]|uniref:Uncharacterized protein n=1 Tax=Paenibacillus sedimenti TaxID=2770274 RepID=A0A926KLZ6_9BACL|nr:hypothetical protein [Paenibacillus sedimenti]MBD0380269.1 hypothetical protein [Paenibacillus sedimenti]
MNPDFIQIKSLEGELKMSHKRKDYGLTVTTKELILHKPHVNYYFKLEDIINILPFDNSGFKKISFVSSRAANQETTHLSPGSEHYRIYVGAATVHNRSGFFQLGATDVIIPIHREILRAISECGQRIGLTAF